MRAVLSFHAHPFFGCVPSIVGALAQVVAEKEAEMALRLSELTREMERAHANELSEKLALAERQVRVAHKDGVLG
jgi:hypothetical protein